MKLVFNLSNPSRALAGQITDARAFLDRHLSSSKIVPDKAFQDLADSFEDALKKLVEATMPEDIDNDGKEEEEREVWSEVLVKMVGPDCTRIAFTRLMENNSEALYLGFAFTEERPPIEWGEPS